MKSHNAYFPCVAGELTPTEEEATSWLWASPRLLAWRSNVIWLWSRVDARRSAARLYGVDSTGSLMIVQIKVNRGQALDPFEHLVLEMKSASNQRDWTAEALYEKWQKCRARNPFARDAVRRFQHEAYERSVERLLDRRERLGNPHPVLFGVAASTRSAFRLSPHGRRSCEQLQKRVGDERVRLRLISGTLDATDRLRVQCQTPDGRESRYMVVSRFG